MQLDPTQISSMISIIVAVTILVANFFQWHDITYNGKMITKKWIKLIFSISIILLLVSSLLIII